ncbi:sensor histidine kinase [Azohydromonas caseinilytica]|uniref:histidine kinase n=1 Tax=Azohydromonas caseinilytica TaxID=2728836 RepID=A0A848F7J8_9BURK|nr:sensor histidine kinase [Azohydromonas caseinilytica]NML14323.1 sensor histidine kinase [Azohydromonas caseinilytica]
MARLSLRARLLLGLLVPVLALVSFNAWSLYRQALRAANQAYDRTLLATAKSIGELLYLSNEGGKLRLNATVPYAALEAFEADNRSRLYYRVTGFEGEVLSGYADLPRWQGRIPDRPAYAALVDFYDDHYHGDPVRMAVLLQPVASPLGQGMATIQVAETLELRRALARELLLDTLWRQALLVAVIALVVVWVVQRATAPVRRLSEDVAARDEDTLAPIHAPDAPRELQPLIRATNEVLARLGQAAAQQKRFVRDASHQLRTPLAVLRVQVQSARRGDLPPEQALREIGTTVERATLLVNQMLALAKVEQLRQQGDAPVSDWAPIVQGVALELSALIAQRGLDFELDLGDGPAPVRAHEWALRELTRNLLHNAIRHTRSLLLVRLQHLDGQAVLTIRDDGPGIPAEQRRHLFQAFAASTSAGGSGLGLAICHEIVMSLGGRIELLDRGAAERLEGLDAVVHLALADNRAP